MTLPELIYIVASVETASRLGRTFNTPAGIDAMVEALLAVNQSMAEQSLVEKWTYSEKLELSERFPRWSGAFYASVL